jgi:hypothetical protein
MEKLTGMQGTENRYTGRKTYQFCPPEADPLCRPSGGPGPRCTPSTLPATKFIRQKSVRQKFGWRHWEKLFGFVSAVGQRYGRKETPSIAEAVLSSMHRAVGVAKLKCSKAILKTLKKWSTYIKALTFWATFKYPTVRYQKNLKTLALQKIGLKH